MFQALSHVDPAMPSGRCGAVAPSPLVLPEEAEVPEGYALDVRRAAHRNTAS